MVLKKLSSKTDILNERSSGILFHPMSLLSQFGCGDIGKSSRDFLKFLSQSKQSIWQMLPVNTLGKGDCPYSARSAFAGEPLLICCESLIDLKLLSKKDIDSHLSKYSKKIKASFRSSKIDYNLARSIKYPLFKKAFLNFSNLDYSCNLYKKYLHFLKEHKFWLDDYSMFVILSEKFKTGIWSKWCKEYRSRDKKSLERLKIDYKKELDFERFKQFIFFYQWDLLKKEANQLNISLMGDIPIFVSYESSDVWSHQKYFYLNKDGSSKFISGAPPDTFCKRGQLWGTPLYDWKTLQKDKFSWWIERFIHSQKLFDSTRIDHFIGFYHFWATPSTAKTAESGSYRKALGDKLLEELFKHGSFSLVAEDLGKVSKPVLDLRDKYNIPGMRILEFGFWKKDLERYHHPSFYSKDSVAYIGTHDMSTSVGWLKSLAKDSSIDKELIKGYLGVDKIEAKNIEDLSWKLVHNLMLSSSNVVIFQMQDILGLDDSCRMNLPGTVKGNWVWKLNLNDNKKLKECSTKLSYLVLGSCRG